MFKAKIKDGKLSLGHSKQTFLEYLSFNEGKTLIIAPEKKGRSNSQNAYYWVYLGIIEKETGENANDLHEYFKRKLLPPVFKKIRGEDIKLPRSTTKLNKVDFGEYLDKICAMTNVPLPNPEDAGYISNYGPMKPYARTK